MKIIDYEYKCSKQNNLLLYYENFFKDEKFLFFDIETTGFSAQNTTLYLIGALWYEEDTQYIRQWFNQDGKSEKEILASFFEFCNQFSGLIHFNGLGFDLPYLKQKATHYEIPFLIDCNMYQIDIYKEIRPFKDIMQLDNMKQVNIERYLSIHRDDIYTGKDLIRIFQQYVAKSDAEKERQLLLHNHDDLLGMPKISQILNIKAFFLLLSQNDITISSVHQDDTNKLVEISFSFPQFAFLPKRISISYNALYLNAFETKATLQVSFHTATLKHFLPDYKNYYYLPYEDTAIHKSIASFVESTNKQKATKSTCFVKKTDTFIPCFNFQTNESFQFEYNDKDKYITVDTLVTTNHTSQYVIDVLRTLSGKK